MVNPTINTVYTITVWDTIPGFCGYSVTDTIRIDYKPRVLDILNQDTLVCQGTQIPIIINGTPGYTYQWSPGTGVTNPTDQNPVITADQSAVYTVTASYPGCADTVQSIAIQVDMPVGANFINQPDSICTGESIFFIPQTDSTAINLHWQFGDGTEMTSPNENIHHAYDIPGTLPVVLSAKFRACPDTSFTDTVYVYALPKVYLGPDSGLCLHGAPIMIKNLEPAPIVAYHNLWNTGDTTESLKVVHPGLYSLSVSNEPLGCSTTESITITKDCYIDIPNAFTPNGDGENDYFFPRQLLSRKVTQFNMQIFNRWGQVIFETTNTAGRGWDGKFNDKNQPTGVYIYLIDAEIDGHLKEHYQGNVTLIR
jgi:gliding motility-associated-like protein